MSQPTSVTVPPVPDVTIMKWLGYVRLLHDQAVAQSYAPPPLNFSAVLAFHDVMEYFFIVAVAHVGGSQGIDLKTTFVENARRLKAPDGHKMSCLDAVNRTGQYRNGFKHNGAVPGPDQVEHARRDATAFLEANCPRFFGVDLNDISMLHIVQQPTVRDRLKAGRAAADAGDIHTAMAEVALAFHELISEWGRGKRLPGSSFQREDLDLSPHSFRHRRRLDISSRPRDYEVRSTVESLISEVTKAFEETDKEIESLRHALRIQLAGIDTARYIRFAMIAPQVEVPFNGQPEAYAGLGEFHYTIENYEFCETFVVDSALKLGVSDFNLWMPMTFGDVARAKEAMEANGGSLPDNWE
jgi:hypothetical protein